MKIFLNTRSFEKDYQWFSLNNDDSVSVSQNFWNLKEISKLPISDNFSVTMGKLENDEFFLITTDLYSGREDGRGREIKNSFMFISEDEIILRKLTTILLFDYLDFVDSLNYLISDFQGSESGFSAKYSDIMIIIENFSEKYEIQFEFDSNIDNARISRFAELFLSYEATDNLGDKVLGYKLNNIFEIKLKRFLLSEIFPEDINIIFAYIPNLTLKHIEDNKIYLSVGRTLDKFAKNIFTKDVEEWAIFEQKDSSLQKWKNFFYHFKSELLVITLILFIFIPLISSYINLYTENKFLQNKTQDLNSNKINIEKNNRDLLEQLKSVESKIILVEDRNSQLIFELDEKDEKLYVLEQKFSKKNVVTNINVPKTLKQCQRKLNSESVQRKKLAVGYKWYQGLYNKCIEKE